MRKIVFILLIVFNSCSEEPDCEKYLDDIGIKLSEKYVVSNYATGSAIGDYGVTFDLQISDKDFEIIKEKIKHSKNYNEVGINDFPNDFSVYSKDDKISGYKARGNYFYSVSKAKTNENYQIMLIPKNKLSLTYMED